MNIMKSIGPMPEPCTIDNCIERWKPSLVACVRSLRKDMIHWIMNTGTCKRNSLRARITLSTMSNCLGEIWRVYRAYVENREPRKTKIGTEVAHVTRDSDTTFVVKRSKVNLQGVGAYCGGLPHSLFLSAFLWCIRSIIWMSGPLCLTPANSEHRWWGKHALTSHSFTSALNFLTVMLIVYIILYIQDIKKTVVVTVS